MAVLVKANLPNGTNVCFDFFFWSSPSTCLPICFRPGGTVYCVCLSRRGRPWYTIQIMVFVGGPLLEAIAPFGKLIAMIII